MQSKVSWGTKYLYSISTPGLELDHGNRHRHMIALKVRTWPRLMVILVLLMTWKMTLAAQRSSAVSVHSQGMASGHAAVK